MLREAKKKQCQKIRREKIQNDSKEIVASW